MYNVLANFEPRLNSRFGYRLNVCHASKHLTIHDVTQIVHQHNVALFENGVIAKWNQRLPSIVKGMEAVKISDTAVRTALERHRGSSGQGRSEGKNHLGFESPCGISLPPGASSTADVQVFQSGSHLFKLWNYVKNTASIMGKWQKADVRMEHTLQASLNNEDSDIYNNTEYPSTTKAVIELGHTSTIKGVVDGITKFFWEYVHNQYNVPEWKSQQHMEWLLEHYYHRVNSLKANLINYTHKMFDGNHMGRGFGALFQMVVSWPQMFQHRKDKDVHLVLALGRFMSLLHSVDSKQAWQDAKTIGLGLLDSSFVILVFILFPINLEQCHMTLLKIAAPKFIFLNFCFFVAHHSSK